MFYFDICKKKFESTAIYLCTYGSAILPFPWQICTPTKTVIVTKKTKQKETETTKRLAFTKSSLLNWLLALASSW